MVSVKTISGNPLYNTTFALLLNTALTSLIGFVFWRVITGYYPDASQVGEATTLIALVSTTTLLSVSGLTPAILLSLSSNSNVDIKRTIHGNSFLAGMVAIALTGLVQLILSFFNNFDFLRNPIVFFAGIITAGLTAAGSVVDATAMSIQKPFYVPIRNSGQSLGKTLLVFPSVFILTGVQNAAVLIVTLTAFIAGFIITLGIIRKVSGRWFLRYDDILYSWSQIKNNLGHHQMSSLGGSLPPVVTPLIMTGMLGTEESAIFSIVWMIGALFFTVSPSVSNAVLSSTANRGEVVLKKRMIEASILVTVLMLVPMIFVFIFPDLVLGFFGDAYIAGSMLLILLALAALPDAATNIAVAYLRLKHDFKPATFLNVSMGIATLLLIVILIPFVGINAPGLAWLVSQGIGSIVILLYIGFRYTRRKA
jgi:O-antigen/teichoic acid export membrane protein